MYDVCCITKETIQQQQLQKTQKKRTDLQQRIFGIDPILLMVESLLPTLHSGDLTRASAQAQPSFQPTMQLNDTFSVTRTTTFMVSRFVSVLRNCSAVSNCSQFQRWPRANTKGDSEQVAPCPCRRTKSSVPHRHQ